MTVDNTQFIPVNSVLNMKPSLGPIPADQVVPWAVIAIVNIILVKHLMGASWIVTILSICWGASTWWILTGSDSSQFLSKFHPPPVWGYGNLLYVSPLVKYLDLTRENEPPARALTPRRQKRQPRTRKIRF